MCGIDLSLNLGLLGYPSQYVIVSYTLEAYDEDSVFCKVVDVTDPIIIPPPDFSISTFSSTIALLPAESKIAELQVKSNTNLQSYVLLSTGTNSNVKLSFEPNKLYVPPFGISSSLMHVTPLNNAPACLYTLPIKANWSFPIAVSNSLTGDINTEALIRNQANFTALVRPPLSASEIIKDYLISNSLLTISIPIIVTTGVSLVILRFVDINKSAVLKNLGIRDDYHIKSFSSLHWWLCCVVIIISGC